MQKIILSLVLLIGSCGWASAQSPAPAGDAANGQKLFMADGCYQCHGTVGQGSRGTGPRLAPNPMPYENFSAQLRKPLSLVAAFHLPRAHLISEIR